MADRMRVTSLMRSRITAGEVPGQRRGRGSLGGRRVPGPEQEHALELRAGGRWPGPLLGSEAPRSTARFFPALQDAFTGRLPCTWRTPSTPTTRSLCSTWAGDLGAATPGRDVSLENIAAAPPLQPDRP